MSEAKTSSQTVGSEINSAPKPVHQAVDGEVVTAGHGSGEEVPPDEWLRLEYEYVNQRWINGTSQRRGGMAFFTGVQGAVLGLIGNDLLLLQAKGFALALFAMLVTIIAWNNERRIGAYMTGYLKRMLEIERYIGIRTTIYGRDEAKRQRTISNRRLFAFYFLAMILAWGALILYNLIVRINNAR
jgi:hypothetical protein